MAYANSPSTQTLLRRISTTLALEQVDTAGRDSEVFADAINEAAREVGNEIVRINRRLVQYTKVYTVGAGDASIALPDGSEQEYPRWRRIIEVLRTDTTAPYPLDVIEGRETKEEPALYQRGSLALVFENLTLRFASSTGAPAAMEITLRYLAALPEVSATALSATPFDLLAPEWVDVIVLLATAKLIPAVKGGVLARYQSLADRKLAELRAATLRQVHTGTTYVRRVP